MIMRDMHEGKADLGLNPLQFDLHLAAKFQIKCAKRFIEKQ